MSAAGFCPDDSGPRCAGPLWLLAELTEVGIAVADAQPEIGEIACHESDTELPRIPCRRHRPAEADVVDPELERIAGERRRHTAGPDAYDAEF